MSCVIGKSVRPLTRDRSSKEGIKRGIMKPEASMCQAAYLALLSICLLALCRADNAKNLRLCQGTPLTSVLLGNKSTLLLALSNRGESTCFSYVPGQERITPVHILAPGGNRITYGESSYEVCAIEPKEVRLWPHSSPSLVGLHHQGEAGIYGISWQSNGRVSNVTFYLQEKANPTFTSFIEEEGVKPTPTPTPQPTPPPPPLVAAAVLEAPQTTLAVLFRNTNKQTLNVRPTGSRQTPLSVEAPDGKTITLTDLIPASVKPGALKPGQTAKWKTDLVRLFAQRKWTQSGFYRVWAQVGKMKSNDLLVYVAPESKPSTTPGDTPKGVKNSAPPVTSRL